MLSVVAVHDRSTDVGEVARAASPPGADGAVVSIVHVDDTGAGFGPLDAIVLTVKVWLPGVSALRVAGLVHGDDGPEDLPLYQLIVLGDAGDDGGLEEEPGPLRLDAAGDELGARRTALEQPLDASALALRVERAECRVG